MNDWFFRLFDNFLLKIVSLFLALVLFVMGHSDQNAARTLEVDLLTQPPDPSSNDILLTQIPAKLNVTVRGPRALIDDLPSSYSRLTLDLSGRPNELTFENLLEKPPPGLHVVGLFPSSIHLTWDTRVSRQLRIEPTWSTLPEGLQFKKATLIVDPSVVTLVGPRSRVEPIQKMLTTSLDLRDRKPGHNEQSLAVDKAAEGLTDGLVDVIPSRVVVSFDLEAETKSRAFPTASVVVLHGKASVRPAMVSFVVTCSPPSRADELRPEALIPTLDLSQFGSNFGSRGPEEARVEMELPAGCTEVTISPEKVVVTK
jgi:YbbR domain-containing protein